MIVHSADPITLIGGSRNSRQALDQALTIAPYLVAADGGANQALAHGIVPKAVIGDLDSLNRASRGVIPESCQHKISEQNSTDFDKCMRNIQAPLILAVGFTGARTDHQLAAFNTLVRHPQRRCLLIGETDLIFLAPPSLRLDLPPGCRLSLFPMGAVEGVSDGLRWPIAGINFAPDGRVGTSNQTTGPVDLSFTAPKMLVIVPVDMFELTVAALQDTLPTWE
ncbi:Thiamin pyrophosphokinase [hydrothermal vent metagenome]|uniref:Thiamin pyrophosphokinase n=1 Tax=hydrothermal vent metagenome TaxID=652676 RepID=A0A3B0SL38_9ZZZZ